MRERKKEREKGREKQRETERDRERDRDREREGERGGERTTYDARCVVHAGSGYIITKNLLFILLAI